jgi:hypothetical protein
MLFTEMTVVTINSLVDELYRMLPGIEKCKCDGPPKHHRTCNTLCVKEPDTGSSPMPSLFNVLHLLVCYYRTEG